ncbi:MAG: glycosyltransferase family 4 protein [Deltaproteobacteria bacterium]|nr:glycosyltransferase family 4 protein [Deltaproteobacteria bacterium]
MNILILTDVLFPDTIGGAGRVAYHLSLGLSQKGHDVHIITRNAGGKSRSDEQLAPKMYIHRFDCPEKKSLSFFISEIPKSSALANRLFSQIEFDMVCAHQPMIATGPLRSKAIKNLPLIYYYHSPWHEEYLVKRSFNARLGINTRLIAIIMRWIEKRVVKKADKIVVLSDYMKEKVSFLHDYPEGRISKIPGGIDLNRFHLPKHGKESVKETLHFPQDKMIFLTVRNLVSRMGLENLIQVFHGSETLQKKATLYIGGQGPLERQLRSMVHDLKLQDIVHFLGHIPDDELPRFYQAADFFVLPTTKLEGFGLVILEAMACGTPVLGTPVGAIPEVIGAFDKRLLFKSTDQWDIQRKMEDLINTEGKYRFSPETCRHYILNHFSWEKVVEMFEKEMKNLM